MKKAYVTAILIVATFGLLAQHGEEATTRFGRRVILNSDGTWKYLGEKKTATVKRFGECSDIIETSEDKVTL